MSTREDQLLNSRFVLISLVWMVVFASYYVLIATLPVYVLKQVGGQEADIGFVMGMPTISTVLLLPFFGRVADRRGRRFVLFLGIIGLTVSGPIYALANTLPLLLILRFFYGAVWAAAVAALVTLVADVSPVNRRGEAMGYSNMLANIALAIGPSLGLAVVKAYDFTALFMVVTALTIVALLLALGVPETMGKGREAVANAPAVAGQRRLRSILFSPMIMLCITISYGTLLSFLPIYAMSKGIDNPGIFFTFVAGFIIISRATTGRLSDRLGRRAVIVPGMGLVAVSLLLLSASTTLPAMLAVAVLYGTGFGSAHSSLMALAADYADEATRGVAMSYLAAAVELGIGLGAIILGLVVQLVGYSGMYVTAGIVAIVGVIAFVLLEQGFKPVAGSTEIRVQVSE